MPTNATPDIHLSPSEAARKLGVSPKALRLYERHGLVTPIRASNGYRAYGPPEMAKLHQVLALKGLGLPLKQIAELLAGRLAALDAVLELQEELLQRQSDRLGRALTLVQSARKRLACGENLSIDDLTHLTTETTMTAHPTKTETEAVFQRLKAKHFSAEERAALAQKPYDQAAVTAAWDALIAEAKALMAIGNPESPEALDLARRWQALIAQFTGGDPVITGKLRAVWQEALADPKAGPALPINAEMMTFVGQALKNLTAAPNIP